MTLNVHHLWPRPLVTVTQEARGLGIHGEDAALAIKCPIYQGANARAFYICAAADMRFRWNGGDSYAANISTWAMEAYESARDAWAANAGLENPFEVRYAMDSPFGGRAGGGHMLHAGGLMLSLFTGLAIRVPEGFGLHVLPAVNFRYQCGWTIQNAFYPHDYRGEFSINIQVIRQGEDFHINAGMPFASLILSWDHPVQLSERPVGAEYPDISAEFYRDKARRLGVK